MIKTPFGSIVVEINGENLNYCAKELGQYKHFYVDKRFQIVVSNFTVGDTIECMLDSDGSTAYESGTEPGEDLALITFYHKNLILSIGAIGDLIGVEYTYLSNSIHVELSFGLDYYNFGDIDEFTNFLTMKDKFFQGYSLTVDLKEVSKSRYQIAGEVFEFVQMLKAHNFEPSEIFFSVLFNEESERTLFSIFDLENVNSVENIFALIEEWG